MNKLITLIFCSFTLFSCTPTPTLVPPLTTSPTSPPATTSLGNCQPGEVELVGYSDKGKRLANCFVEYPGEPSRQDKSYYIVEDICGQFTPQLISNSLGKQVVNTKASDISTLYNCSYYTNENNYVMLVLNYLKAENQKIGQESMGRKVVTDSRIPIRNWVVYQENGLINSIHLILSDDKFLSIQRSNTIDLTADQLIDFAAKIGGVIKNYK